MAPWATATTHAHILPPQVNDIQEFPSLGGVPQDPVPRMNSTEDFPSLGGGIPKFAGRREPPPASHAPSPPSSWSTQQQQKPSIHDAVRMMEEEEVRRASPTTTDYYSDSSSASSQSRRKLTLHEAVQLKEHEERERQMRAMESQKQRLPSTAPKALQAGRAQPVVAGRGRGRGVPGGLGRGYGLLGGVGRGQPKMANKPPINMGKPPSQAALQDSDSSSSRSSQNHRLPQGNATFGINMGQRPSALVEKPTVENDKVSVSGWSSASQQSTSKSVDEYAHGDHDDAASTATWDSIFSGLPSMQQAGFSGDSMDFPTLAQATSQQKPKPSLGRGRGVLQITNYIRPPPGFQKSDLEGQFSDINVGE